MQKIQGSTGYYTEANSINANGDIAGFGQLSSGVNRALRWDGGSGSPQDLRTLAGIDVSKNSYAYGINSAGKIVGKSETSTVGIYHAFRTAPLGIVDSTSDLGTYRGPSFPNDLSEGQALNDFDEIVGASHVTGGQYHAVYKTRSSPANSGFIDLQVFPGHDRSVAYSINNRSQVVGMSKLSSSSGSERAFIWQKDSSGMQNLLYCLPANISGWELHEAFSINDSGQIVGWGYHNGAQRGFILTPN